MTKQEAILEGRRKHAAGEFERKIIQRVPESFAWDTAELECGHKEKIANFQTERQSVMCLECCTEWIERNTNL